MNLYLNYEYFRIVIINGLLFISSTKTLVKLLVVKYSIPKMKRNKTKPHEIVPLSKYYDENQNPSHITISHGYPFTFDKEYAKIGIIDAWEIHVTSIIKKNNEKIMLDKKLFIMIFKCHSMQLYSTIREGHNVVETSKQLLSGVIFDLSKSEMCRENAVLYVEFIKFIKFIKRYNGNVTEAVLIYNPYMDDVLLTMYKKQIGFQSDISKLKDMFKTNQSVFDDLTEKLKYEEKEVAELDSLISKGTFLQTTINQYTKDVKHENILSPYIKVYEHGKQEKLLQIKNIKSQINNYYENNQSNIINCDDILAHIFKFLSSNLTVYIYPVGTNCKDQIFYCDSCKEQFNLYITLTKVNSNFRLMAHKTIRIDMRKLRVWWRDENINIIHNIELPIKVFDYDDNLNFNECLEHIKYPYIHRLILSSKTTPTMDLIFRNVVREIKLDINMIQVHYKFIKKMNSNHIIFTKTDSRISEFVGISKTINNLKKSINYYYNQDDVLMQILVMIKTAGYHLEHKENDNLSLYDKFQSIDKNEECTQTSPSYCPTSPSYCPTSPSYCPTEAYEIIEDNKGLKTKPLPYEHYWIYGLKSIGRLSESLKQERQELIEKKEKKILLDIKKQITQ